MMSPKITAHALAGIEAIRAQARRGELAIVPATSHLDTRDGQIRLCLRVGDTITTVTHQAKTTAEQHHQQRKDYF